MQTPTVSCLVRISVHVGYSLNSLRGGSYRGLYDYMGSNIGLVKGYATVGV